MEQSRPPLHNIVNGTTDSKTLVIASCVIRWDAVLQQNVQGRKASEVSLSLSPAHCNFRLPKRNDSY